MSERRPYTRHGLHAIKARVKVAGLAAIDGRTAAAQGLLEWRRDLIADLGGDAAVSAQQRALIEVATRTRLYVDHLDAFLMSQRSLVNLKRKAVLPVLKERQTLADSLARILGQLGLERKARPIQSLQDYLASKTRERTQADGASARETELSSPASPVPSAPAGTAENDR